MGDLSMAKYSKPRRPMETDKFYRYVSLRSFDRFKETCETKRARDLLMISNLREEVKRLSERWEARFGDDPKEETKEG